MVWRSEYKTLVARDVMLPMLLPVEDQALPDFQIIIGAISFRGYREMAIWKRLIQSDGLWDRTLQAIILESPTTDDLQLAETMVPKSEQQRTRVCCDPDLQWANLVQLERPEQCFAAVVTSGRARIMLKGVPTEDAWDAFVAEVRLES